MEFETEIKRAAGSLSCATALLITSGSGMAAASDLIDTIPEPFDDARLFKKSAKRAWGFFAMRRQNTRMARPNAGFGVLARWADGMKHGVFVFTSNPDGQFQRAYFFADRIVECRGAVEWMQCTQRCGDVFPGGLIDIALDAKGYATDPLPTCPRCGSLARPNIAIGEDKDWDSSRTHEQEDRLNTWLAELRAMKDKKLVVIECGASGNPDVRARGDRVAAALGGTLVRIDPHEAAGGIRMGIVEALGAIDSALARLRGAV